MTEVNVRLMSQTLDNLILSGIAGISSSSPDGKWVTTAKMDPYGVMLVTLYGPNNWVKSWEVNTEHYQKVELYRIKQQGGLALWQSTIDFEKLWD